VKRTNLIGALLHGRADLDHTRAWWILSPSEREATATKNAANRLSIAVPRDFQALTPLVWEHVNPYGRYELDI
jgi:hypothetical protein